MARGPQTDEQRRLSEARRLLREARAEAARLLRTLRTQKARRGALDKEQKRLEKAHRAYVASGGQRGEKASPKARAAAKERVQAVTASAKETEKLLRAAKKRAAQLGVITRKAERQAAKAKAFYDQVLRKERARHRQIHRRLDAEALNRALPPELRMPLPPWPGERTYPRAELEAVAHLVCEWMRFHLENAARDLGALAFVYRYPETLEVDGRFLFKLPDGTELNEMIAIVADALRPMVCTVTTRFGPDKPLPGTVSSLYYHESFFQSALTIYSTNEEFSSPGDRSRVLPGGIKEIEFDSNWTKESHDHALQILASIYEELLEVSLEREEEFELGLFELRFHWSLSGARPERLRPAPDRTLC